MNYPRKTFAAFAFVVAFAAAIGLTTFMQLRPATPPLAESPTPSVSPPTAPQESSMVPFRAEQIILDFAAKRSYMTLVHDPRAGQRLPAKMWIWVDYYAPEATTGSAPYVTNGVWEVRRWTSEPTEISVSGKRKIEITAACPVCSERPASKQTFYARIHLSAVPPDRASVEAAHGNYNLADMTPVIVRGIEEAVR